MIKPTVNMTSVLLVLERCNNSSSSNSNGVVVVVDLADDDRKQQVNCVDDLDLELGLDLDIVNSDTVAMK